MENIENITIETERLILVPTTQEYLQEIFNEFTDEVTKYMFPNSPKEINETKKRIDDCIQRREKWEELQMTILDKITREFLGNAWLHGIKESIPELWIRIKKAAHGKKIGREAVAALEAWAQQNLNFDYIEYPVDKDNIWSRKIAESLNGIVEKDEQGNEKVEIVPTFNNEGTINEVMYRIPKKLKLPKWLEITKDISDMEFEHMISIMEANDLSRYIISKEQFYVIKNDKNEIIAFGRIFDIWDKQSEIWSLRVDEKYRWDKLWLLIMQELIKEKKWENSLYLATKRELGKYYEKLGFEIITDDIPEKLVHTGIRATWEGIDFIIMKLK